MVHKPDICVFTETWLSDKVLPPQFDGYTGFHLFREHKKGGGVSIYAHNNIKSEDISLPQFTTLEVIARRITLHKSTFVTLCCYRPPNTDVNVFLTELDELFGHLSTGCSQCSIKDNWVIAGDFNINLLGDDSKAEKFYGCVIITLSISIYICSYTA
jgi:exonuclease III